MAGKYSKDLNSYSSTKTHRSTRKRNIGKHKLLDKKSNYNEDLGIAQLSIWLLWKHKKMGSNFRLHFLKSRAWWHMLVNLYWVGKQVDPWKSLDNPPILLREFPANETQTTKRKCRWFSRTTHGYLLAICMLTFEHTAYT